MATDAVRRRPEGAALGPVPSLVASARVRDFAPGEGEPAGAAAPGHDDGDWIAVSVPGDVHRALIEAEVIAHPFHDRHEGDCAWMEAREWWYRFAFDAPAGELHHSERVRLIFHGLDTYATVWLNGAELGRHGNMFREAVFDVTERVRVGEANTVAIRFDPPLAHAGPPLPGQWAPNNHERVWMRKAQFGYGWDWGPRLPTIGIWRPLELRRERGAALTGVRCDVVELAPDHSHALVAVHADAERFACDAPLTVAVSLAPPGAPPLDAGVALENGPAPTCVSTSRACGGHMISASRRSMTCASRCSTTGPSSTRASCASACARSRSTSRPTPMSPARASSASSSTASGSSRAGPTGSRPSRSSVRSPRSAMPSAWARRSTPT